MKRFFGFISSLPRRGAIALVNFYRRAISPLKKPCCRFHPTCSQYALEAFRRFGFVRGLLLAVWRILRCNPFCQGGIDPVPERFTFRRQAPRDTDGEEN
ncbi:MAG: membrane protein insertion efficiency factor YidD [Clostridia bacterium]|nr:membrane protein insertion efficiency factor YidD [Clostridia bacterium]